MTDTSLFLFIIWERARNHTDSIMNDLNENFSIRDVFEIEWNKNEFLQNLKRFYGKSLPDAKQKATTCGMGPFLLIVVSDSNPDLREPSKSNFSSERDLVNVNILNSKLKYRKLIGEEFTVHSTVSENETEHNLTLLFGKNKQDFLKGLPEKWNGNIKKISQDLVASNGWDSMEQLLYVMNGTIDYVILRNFEGMPKEFDYHDVDMLTVDEKLPYIVKNNFSLSKDNPESISFLVGEKNITLNPNYLGQHYYDQKWEKDILKRRILHPNGFYVPSKMDYFYTLLYHVIFHGRWKESQEIRDDYKKKLLELAEELKIEKISEKSLNNKNFMKGIIEQYLKQMSYKRSDTASYKFRHNETSRLAKTSIFILKNHGLQHLLYAVKEKIKFVLKLRY